MLPRLLLAILLTAAAAFAQPQAELFSQVDHMVTTLSEITGWPIRHKVPSEILSKDSFRHYLEEHTKGSSRKKEIHVEELALKMFGLIPQDFDLGREEVDLLGEQAAAFYDYKKKRLFILDSTRNADDQREALVHELAHALADQQHPLGKYLDHGSPDDDEATAREAVMEGQATWLTWAYEAKLAGGKAEVPARLIDRLTQPDEPNAEFPVFTAAPLYLRESLIFPYNAGARFQDAVYRKLGKQAFEAVFQRPPRSTQQIMHPDAYLKDEKPATTDPPALEAAIGKDGRQFRPVIEGAVGEFDIAMLLRQYVGDPEGAAAAAHWHGGAFRLYEHKPEKSPLLFYVSEWDTPAAARAFFGLYQRVLKGKWKNMEVASQTETEVRGTGDSGRFMLRVSGASVQSIEGLR
jgi:hypothetical protein